MLTIFSAAVLTYSQLKASTFSLRSWGSLFWNLSWSVFIPKASRLKLISATSVFPCVADPVRRQYCGCQGCAKTPLRTCFKGTNVNVKQTRCKWTTFVSSYVFREWRMIQFILKLSPVIKYLQWVKRSLNSSSMYVHEFFHLKRMISVFVISLTWSSQVDWKCLMLF